MKDLNLGALQQVLAEANQAVGRLDGLTSAFPDLNLLLYSYVRKEAVLSSMIEGTQSSLSDLMLYENAETPGVPLHDVVEVSNYAAALSHGIKRIRDGFPLSLRLMREIHQVLLSRGRGSHATPGEFRRSQNWIGGLRPGDAVFVPPPPEYVMDCMSQLEAFVHEEGTGLPLLVRAGLVHAQFETIHPFLDGNGRVGRLLITFMLCTEEVLREPVLYLSLFFKQHRALYYERLNATREKGAWTEWLGFFLQGVRDTANQAARMASHIDQLFRMDKEKIESFGRGAASAAMVYRYTQANPLFSVKSAAKALEISFPTASAAVDRLLGSGILREFTGRRRGRVFLYDKYMELLSRDINQQSGISPGRGAEGPAQIAGTDRRGPVPTKPVEGFAL
jgi:Fic family protein